MYPAPRGPGKRTPPPVGRRRTLAPPPLQDVHWHRAPTRRNPLDTADHSTSRASPEDTRTAPGVRCWGTRGSIASPGASTARYGGNTTCVEVCHAGHRLILDAGTGIRPLGVDLLAGGDRYRYVFLTHFHWDHIQGFPFFAPLYDPDVELRVVAPRQDSIDVRSLFAGQMGPIYFPIPFSAVAARVTFEHLGETEREVDGAVVRWLRVRHPSHAVGYRIEVGGRVVCFIPDNEVEGEGYDVGAGWRDRLVDFVREADLLVHDAMYTDEEYARRSGWGHSTHRQALRLAEDAGVKRLLFFHHDPARTDGALEEIVARLRDEAAARGCPVSLDAAAEGPRIPVGGD